MKRKIYSCGDHERGIGNREKMGSKDFGVRAWQTHVEANEEWQFEERREKEENIRAKEEKSRKEKKRK
jgi:hypothetical protein